MLASFTSEVSSLSTHFLRMRGRRWGERFFRRARFPLPLYGRGLKQVGGNGKPSESVDGPQSARYGLSVSSRIGSVHADYYRAIASLCQRILRPGLSTRYA